MKLDIKKYKGRIRMKMIKKIFNAIVLYLSMLSIRSVKIWVFGSWAGEKFADNPKYMYLYMNESEDIKSIWISKRKDIVEKLQRDGFKAYLSNSLKGIWYQLRAKYIFFCVAITDVNEYLIGNAYLINLTHGIGGKKSGYNDKLNKDNTFNKNKLSLAIKSIPRRKSFYLSTSYSYDHVIEETFRANNYQIIHAGFPRNDLFFRDITNNPDKSYPAERKYILYLPTHRHEGKVTFDLQKIMDLEKINQLLAENNYMMIIKKHFYHNHEKNMTPSYSNIIDLTGSDYDTQLLMKESIMLITDYSTCYVDYLLTGNPIGFYCFDLDEYQRSDRELVFQYDKSTPGFKAQNSDELYENIKEYIVDHYDKYECDRKTIQSMFFDDYAICESSSKIEKTIKTGMLKRAYKFKKSVC